MLQPTDHRKQQNIQSADDLVSETLSSNPAFSRGRQLVSFRFEYRLPVPVHRNLQQQTCISPELGANANWQWVWVDWILADTRDGLSNSSFFSFILESSVGLSAGIQSADDLVSETLGSNPASKLTTTNIYRYLQIWGTKCDTLIHSKEYQTACFVWLYIW